MKLVSCVIISVVLIQIITAQVISYAPRNGLPVEPATSNQPQNIMANNNPINAVPNNGFPRTAANSNGMNMLNNMQFMPHNMAKSQVSMNEQPIPANQPIGGVITSINLADITNGNANGQANSNLAAMAGANLANIKGNMATFNLGNGGFTVTSGSPDSPAFGINVLADALEVGGMVAVNGQIPIFGAVTLNGNLPTDGSASVSYSCGRPTGPDNA